MSRQVVQGVYHKRGDTFSQGGTATLPAGTWSATAQVRSQDGSVLTEALTVTLTPVVGQTYTHTLLIVATSVQTADWPVGETVHCDIRFADASVPPVVKHTETFAIEVEQEITANA